MSSDRDVISHIRRPNPPWRADALTECGKPEAEFASVISCEDAIAIVRRHGKQRGALFLCMTCMSTAGRHGYSPDWSSPTEPQDWRKDPVAVMHRYLERARWNRGELALEVKAELHALGALVEAHREEFDAYLAAVDAAPDLASRRSAKRAAARYREGT